MKTRALATTLVTLVLSVPGAETFADAMNVSLWRIQEEFRFTAPEARQGVAVDGNAIYVIGNRVIGKYDKPTRTRLGTWEGSPAGPIIHFNAGIVHTGQLILAHSNYPDIPMTGSVEFFDPTDLQPIGSHSFGSYFGSVTWVLPHGDGWLVCFAHYGNRAAEPNRDPTWTSLVRFDHEWRRMGGWVFPKALFEHIGGSYTLSGGAFGPDGLLYVTGHDDPELHVLQFPRQGSLMLWLGSFPMPAEGQAFAWDPEDPERFYGIIKRSREVGVGRLVR